MWKRENRLGKEEYRVEKGTGFGKKGTNRHFTPFLLSTNENKMQRFFTGLLDHFDNRAVGADAAFRNRALAAVWVHSFIPQAQTQTKNFVSSLSIFGVQFSGLGVLVYLWVSRHSGVPCPFFLVFCEAMGCWLSSLVFNSSLALHLQAQLFSQTFEPNTLFSFPFICSVAELQ